MNIIQQKCNINLARILAIIRNKIIYYLTIGNGQRKQETRRLNSPLKLTLLSMSRHLLLISKSGE